MRNFVSIFIILFSNFVLVLFSFLTKFLSYNQNKAAVLLTFLIIILNIVNEVSLNPLFPINEQNSLDVRHVPVIIQNGNTCYLIDENLVCPPPFPQPVNAIRIIQDGVKCHTVDGIIHCPLPTTVNSNQPIGGY